MMNKQRRLSNQQIRNSTESSVTSTAHLVFGSISGNENKSSLDLVGLLRACNSFVDVRDDRSLDGLLKSRVASKMLTLYNMANSDYHVRKSKSVVSPGSRCLLKLNPKIPDFAKSCTKFSDFASLHEFWTVYAVAFLDTLDSMSDILAGEKHGMIVNLFELVGSEMEIIDSPNKQWIGLKGIVFDERSNIIRLITPDSKQRMIPKIACTFRIRIPSRRSVTFRGIEIAGSFSVCVCGMIHMCGSVKCYFRHWVVAWIVRFRL